MTENRLTRLKVVSSIQKQRLEEAFQHTLESSNLISSRTQMRISLDHYNRFKDQESKDKVTQIITDALNSSNNLNKIIVLNDKNDLIIESEKAGVGEIHFFQVSKELKIADKIVGKIIAHYSIEELLKKVQLQSDIEEGSNTWIFTKEEGETVYLNLNNQDIEKIDKLKKFFEVDKNRLFEFEFESNSFFAIKRFSNYAKIGIISTLDKREILKPVNKLRQATLLSLILLIAIAITISLLITHISFKALLAQNQKMKKVNSDLERSNQELEQFAYVASHDLQEPIRMISQNSERLEKHLVNQLDEKSHKYINFILAGAERMNSLIVGLLDFSRVSRLKIDFEKIDLNDVLEITLNNLQKLIEENSVVIESSKLPIIKGDKTQLIRLFQNLISNSIKYKSPDRNLILKIHPKGSIICFEDNGIGFAAEHKDRIFQLFQRLHTRDKHTGSGLGLAICKKIMEHHNGKIWAE